MENLCTFAKKKKANQVLNSSLFRTGSNCYISKGLELKLRNYVLDT